ncbi:hypothetical protein GXM_03527 [Nostoc sphaeroides CCNUC1]|uniref:Uncharacterized protein n=1 Tax=Nostoc sphaeroides CCNUC1 TaxID=2653204 RepID=A0A5P8W033_9NOSO|nr:hypothetical protein GXM_03527 [Nostoc sphaeroides CCNUC1]
MEENETLIGETLKLLASAFSITSSPRLSSKLKIMELFLLKKSIIIDD